MNKQAIPPPPLGLAGSLALFAVPAATLYLAHFAFIPWFITRTGAPYLAGYLVAWPVTMALFLVAALAGYRLEGQALKRQELARRFRLQKMSGADWGWSLGLIVVSLALYFLLGFTSSWLAKFPLFAPGPLVPPDFGPEATSARVPGSLMGMELAGKWWVALVFVVGWLLNIAGEELWFRGYLLPRQEAAMGGRAWLANGLMFGFNHIWQPWNLLMILPSALLGVYIVQRRGNTWILIVMHALMNLALVVVVALNVAGVRV